MRSNTPAPPPTGTKIVRIYEHFSDLKFFFYSTCCGQGTWSLLQRKVRSERSGIIITKVCTGWSHSGISIMYIQWSAVQVKNELIEARNIATQKTYQRHSQRSSVHHEEQVEHRTFLRPKGSKAMKIKQVFPRLVHMRFLFSALFDRCVATTKTTDSVQGSMSWFWSLFARLILPLQVPPKKKKKMRRRGCDSERTCAWFRRNALKTVSESNQEHQLWQLNATLCESQTHRA